MSDPSQSNGQLVWKELLSPKENEEWAVNRKQPHKLGKNGEVFQSGVYRFVFPKDRSCYVGVAEDLGRRLRCHIRPRISQKSENSAKKVFGESVRNAIKGSLGKCYLEYLKIEGAVKFYDVELKEDSIDDFVARLLLENWAILHSEQIDKLRPLNRDIPTGIQKSLKDWKGSAIVIPPDMEWIKNKAGRKRFERARL
jgi:hypothetical protein